MPKHSLLVVLVGSAVLGSAQQLPNCPVRPSWVSIQLPQHGLEWLQGEIMEGACKSVSPTDWLRAGSKTFDLLVYADGPYGSGLVWTITFGVSGKDQADPARGGCFMTSTPGWRTLVRFQDGAPHAGVGRDSPFPWAEDLDADGIPELIVWSSYYLDDYRSDYLLAAWVYRVDPTGELLIDWELSRRLAGELLAAYRAPVDDVPGYIHMLRNQAAQALEPFVEGTCTVPGERAR